MPHDAGHLDALQAEGTPYVKIGYVVSTIEQRRRFLRSQNPFRRLLDLTTIATVRLEQDLAQVEHQLHRLLAAHRYQGEWYTLPLTAEAFRVSQGDTPMRKHYAPRTRRLSLVALCATAALCLWLAPDLWPPPLLSLGLLALTAALVWRAW